MCFIIFVTAAIILLCVANLSTGLRAEIAERKSYIDRMHINVKKLEDEIKTKQNTLTYYKANAKRYK